MLAAPPRANTGAFESRIAVAIAATVRDNFRDVFMASSLVTRRPIAVSPKKVYSGRASPKAAGKVLPHGTYAAESVSVT